jgi:hypothetical protein
MDINKMPGSKNKSKAGGTGFMTQAGTGSTLG